MCVSVPLQYLDLSGDVSIYLSQLFISANDISGQITTTLYRLPPISQLHPPTPCFLHRVCAHFHRAWLLVTQPARRIQINPHVCPKPSTLPFFLMWID